MYTSPPHLKRILIELAKIFVQPVRDAYTYRNFELYEDSINYVKAFRNYSRSKLGEWRSKGLLNMRPCPVCASHECAPRITTPDGVAYVSCSNCGLAFMNPAPSQTAYNAVYESGYDGLLTGWEKTKDKNALCDYRIEKYFGLDVIRRHQKGGKFLDYGGGSGWVFLLSMIILMPTVTPWLRKLLGG